MLTDPSTYTIVEKGPKPTTVQRQEDKASQAAQGLLGPDGIDIVWPRAGIRGPVGDAEAARVPTAARAELGRGGGAGPVLGPDAVQDGEGLRPQQPEAVRDSRHGGGPGRRRGREQDMGGDGGGGRGEEEGPAHDGRLGSYQGEEETARRDVVVVRG